MIIKENQQINKQKKTEDIDEYLEEEIEDFTASKDSNVNNNPMANTSKERKVFSYYLLLHFYISLFLSVISLFYFNIIYISMAVLLLFLMTQKK